MRPVHVIISVSRPCDTCHLSQLKAVYFRKISAPFAFISSGTQENLQMSQYLYFCTSKQSTFVLVKPPALIGIFGHNQSPTAPTGSRFFALGAPAVLLPMSTHIYSSMRMLDI